MVNRFSQQVVNLSNQRAGRLRLYNAVMGAAHLVSALAMAILSNDFVLTVTSFNRSGPPGTPVSEGTLESLFDVPLGLAVSGFLLLSAFFHFLIVSPWGIGDTNLS